MNYNSAESALWDRDSANIIKLQTSTFVEVCTIDNMLKFDRKKEGGRRTFSYGYNSIIVLLRCDGEQEKRYPQGKDRIR